MSHDTSDQPQRIEEIKTALRAAYPWARIQTKKMEGRSRRLGGHTIPMYGIACWASPNGRETWQCGKVLFRIDCIAVAGDNVPDGGVWMTDHLEYDDPDAPHKAVAFLARYMGQAGPLPPDHVHSGLY